MTNAQRNHQIINTSCRNYLDHLDNKSIGLVVTSPPYWQIKDYGREGQIGTDQDYDRYLQSLGTVWEQCHRLLKDGCRLAINIGDQYLRASEYGRYRIKPIPADTIQLCRDIGFDFMGNIIWKKVSTTETTGGGSWMGSTYYPKDGHITYEHEYILLFRKRGDWSPPSQEAKEKSRLTKEQRSNWFRGHWELPPERQDDHVAKFPLELPLRLIKMYSFHGETVLDPFLGSGTTARAALETSRNSIGIELNEEYFKIIRDKLNAGNDLFGSLKQNEGKAIYQENRTTIEFVNFPQFNQQTNEPVS